MKMVSYNLQLGGKIGAVNSWQELIQAFAPDLVFAQESLHPSKFFSEEQFPQFKGCVHENVHHGSWGSAILSKNHILEPISLASDEYKGWVVGARIPDLTIGGIDQSVFVFSIHAPTLSSGSYEKHVDRILGDIANEWGGNPLILAGDFNLTTAALRKTNEELKNTTGEIKILQRLELELGLKNSWQHLHPDDTPPQTLRWSKNKSTPYHCDAIFLNNSHLANLTSAEVISSGVWGHLSDHNPVVVNLH